MAPQTRHSSSEWRLLAADAVRRWGSLWVRVIDPGPLFLSRGDDLSPLFSFLKRQTLVSVSLRRTMMDEIGYD